MRVAGVGDVALGHDTERVLIRVVGDCDGDLLRVLVAACEAVDAGLRVLYRELGVFAACCLCRWLGSRLCRRLLSRAGFALECERRACCRRRGDGCYYKPFFIVSTSVKFSAMLCYDFTPNRGAQSSALTRRSIFVTMFFRKRKALSEKHCELTADS